MTRCSSSKPLRMLFVGDDWYGSNATSLRNGFVQVGVDVCTVDSYQLGSARASLARRFQNKFAPDAYNVRAAKRVNLAVRDVVKEFGPFDVLFVFKGTNVPSEAIENFKGRTVHYHPDDSGNEENRSRIYDQTESLYDYHITTKLHNVSELEARTSSAVQFVRCAYDPAWHSVKEWNSRTRLGLIGTRRPDREAFIARCAVEVGDRMLVAGTGWKKYGPVSNHAEVHPPQFGHHFSDFVSRAPVQLGVLNSANRDTHTCRTFEIPAAGGLFLGEWSEEHEEIFGGKDTCMLYRDEEEALEMIQFLADRPDTVMSLRQRGHRRITLGRNTYADRAAEILARLETD